MIAQRFDGAGIVAAYACQAGGTHRERQQPEPLADCRVREQSAQKVVHALRAPSDESEAITASVKEYARAEFQQVIHESL